MKSKFVLQHILFFCILFILISIMFSCEQISLERVIKVQTDSVMSVTPSSALVSGYFIDKGENEIIQHGHCWSENKTPTVNQNHSALGGITDNIRFKSELSNLNSNTTYYVRAYAATNSITVYGEEVSFETVGSASPEPCPGMPDVSDGEGNIYPTVQIGEQCWMAQNLNVGDRVNADDISEENSTIEKYCYNNREEYCAEYGGLYTWEEMMQYNNSDGINRGICPEGWHIPSDEEWKQLERFLGMSIIDSDADGWRGDGIGEKLKEEGIAHWESPNVANDESGFAARPGGYLHPDKTYNNVGLTGYWWSSTEVDLNYGWNRRLDHDNGGIFRDADDKTYAMSVRCIRDPELHNFLPEVNTIEIYGITNTSAQCLIKVNDSSPSGLTAMGVIWSEQEDLSLEVNQGKNQIEPGVGEYSVEITEIQPATKYFVRAFAVNEFGTGYGNLLSFSSEP